MNGDTSCSPPTHASYEMNGARLNRSPSLSSRRQRRQAMRSPVLPPAGIIATSRQASGTVGQRWRRIRHEGSWYGGYETWSSQYSAAGTLGGVRWCSRPCHMVVTVFPPTTYRLQYQVTRNITAASPTTTDRPPAHIRHQQQQSFAPVTKWEHLLWYRSGIHARSP